MFCSQCGKKVKENMLFCPFCGSPIVIPDQEETHVSEMIKEKDSAEQNERAVESEETFRPDWNTDAPWSDEQSVEEPVLEADAAHDGFVPLDLNALAGSISGVRSKSTAQDEETEDESGGVPNAPRSPQMEAPVKLQGRVPNLVGVQNPESGASGRRNPAKAQLREFNPEDMFLDGGDAYDEDEVDETFAPYEEPERGSFFVRHMRGVVTFSLFAVVVLIVAAWLFSDAGQTSLARANLAWDPDVYAELAREAYSAEQYALCGSYYERALEREPESFHYANSAGIAYYYANDKERSLEMAKQAISLDPTRFEGYQLLLYLYPDVNTRPWDVSTLLQQGYRLTGREELKAG